jgi:hypothetical protein
LSSVIEAARGPLTENGIAFLQAPGVFDEGGIPITTTLVHSSGEWISSTLVLPVAKRDPQGVGSAITYGCRYSLMAMLGLPPVDDDGNATMAPPSTTDPEPRKIAFMKGSLVFVEGQRSLVQWELDNSILFDSLSTEGKIEIEQAKKDRIAELKRRAA